MSLTLSGPKASWRASGSQALPEPPGRDAAAPLRDQSEPVNHSQSQDPEANSHEISSAIAPRREWSRLNNLNKLPLPNQNQVFLRKQTGSSLVAKGRKPRRKKSTGGSHPTPPTTRLKSTTARRTALNLVADPPTQVTGFLAGLPA